MAGFDWLWGPEAGPSTPSIAILCTGGLDVIRKEAWPFCRTSSGVRLCWEIEEPKGPKESLAAGHHSSTPAGLPRLQETAPP